jgi:hypothetical protein
MPKSKPEFATAMIAAAKPCHDTLRKLQDAFPDVSADEAWLLYSRASVLLRLVESGFSIGLDWADIEPQLQQEDPIPSAEEIYAAHKYGLAIAQLRGDEFFMIRRPSEAMRVSTTQH